MILKLNDEHYRNIISIERILQKIGEHNIIDSDFAYSFVNIAGFRNYLLHDYETIQPDIICTKIVNQVNDVEEYVAQIEKSPGIEYYT